jgi:hypothetical protein
VHPNLGDRLICVRYRYDAQQRKRLKTVKIVVAERDWESPELPFADDPIVGLRVAFTEVALRDRVKQAGGRWNPERRVRQLCHGRAMALGLRVRIVADPASTIGCPRSAPEPFDVDTGRYPGQDAGIYREMRASRAR